MSDWHFRSEKNFSDSCRFFQALMADELLFCARCIFSIPANSILSCEMWMHRARLLAVYRSHPSCFLLRPVPPAGPRRLCIGSCVPEVRPLKKKQFYCGFVFLTAQVGGRVWTMNLWNETSCTPQWPRGRCTALTSSAASSMAPLPASASTG